MRPHSAKPYQYYFKQSSDQHKGRDLEAMHNRSQSKLNKKEKTSNLMNAIYSDDFGRIIPKKFESQDIETIYRETLMVKDKLNSTVQHNVKLKTKISYLEKELAAYRKVKDGDQPKTFESKYFSSLRILQETRQQNRVLEQQHKKLKRSIKYCNVMELETRNKTLLDQNKRLNRIIGEYKISMEAYSVVYSNNMEIKQKAEVQARNEKRALEDNNDMRGEYARVVQENERHVQREQKLAREVGSLRAKVAEKEKMIKYLREKGEKEHASIKPAVQQPHQPQSRQQQRQPQPQPQSQPQQQPQRSQQRPSSSKLSQPAQHKPHIRPPSAQPHSSIAHQNVADIPRNKAPQKSVEAKTEKPIPQQIAQPKIEQSQGYASQFDEEEEPPKIVQIPEIQRPASRPQSSTNRPSSAGIKREKYVSIPNKSSQPQVQKPISESLKKQDMESRQERNKRNSDFYSGEEDIFDAEEQELIEQLDDYEEEGNDFLQDRSI